jgi:hypothetical protein
MQKEPLSIAKNQMGGACETAAAKEGCPFFTFIYFMWNKTLTYKIYCRYL